MRSRFRIEAVVLHLLALAGLCMGQTTRSLCGFQPPSIIADLRDANPFGIQLNPDAFSASSAPSEEGVVQDCRASATPRLGELPAELTEASAETMMSPESPGPQQGNATNASRTGNQPADVNNNLDANSKSSSGAVVRPQNAPEYHDDVYYRNKFEFAFDGGWLPINIPFVFDVFLGDAYNLTPLKYTLVPLVASLRWQFDDVGGPWIFRGNWDMTVSGSVTLIPRGPETRYFSYDMGIRRNFVPRRGKIAPYFDGRLGLGEINAKEPLGVNFAQGQNFTFTMNMGAGARYNISPRYAFSAGLNWMHISNLYLSQPAFANYGINVYGPQFGIDIRLGKPRHGSE